MRDVQSPKSVEQHVSPDPIDTTADDDRPAAAYVPEHLRRTIKRIVKDEVTVQMRAFMVQLQERLQQQQNKAGNIRKPSSRRRRYGVYLM